MYALNFTILNSVVGEDKQLVNGAVGAAAILAVTAVYYALSSKDEEHKFPKLRGIQLYHAWNFFERRYDFLQSGFKRNLGKSFSFNVLHHNAIALTGKELAQLSTPTGISTPSQQHAEAARAGRGYEHPPSFSPLLIFGINFGYLPLEQNT